MATGEEALWLVGAFLLGGFGNEWRRFDKDELLLFRNSVKG